jgi:hypothetical protein
MQMEQDQFDALKLRYGKAIVERLQRTVASKDRGRIEAYLHMWTPLDWKEPWRGWRYTE